jgi:hypothetical protein
MPTKQNRAELDRLRRALSLIILNHFEGRELGRRVIAVKILTHHPDL